MFPIKRFIQGPSLHDESEAGFGNQPEKVVPKQTFTGEEASKIYQEIIELPSSNSNSTSAPEIVELSQSNEASSSFSVASSSKASSKSASKSKSNNDDCVPVPPKLSKLMTLCEFNKYLELEETLKSFQNQVDVNTVDEFGWTLLISASCAGSVECVSILLQRGADWTIKDKRGLTALSIAEKNRREDVCDLLNEWEKCYFDHWRRLKLGQIEEGTSQESDDDNSSNDGEYCEMCRFHYKSSKEFHEKSIAHLVSTAQFGGDKTHFGIPESNRGFQLMVKSGWDKNSGLGPEGKGHKFPVKTVLKRNRLGLGNEKERKLARVTHFAPFDPTAVETVTGRIERDATVRRRDFNNKKGKDRRKEINFRREFSSL